MTVYEYVIPLLQDDFHVVIPALPDESEEGIRAYLQDLENREKASVAVRRHCVNFGKYTVMFTDIMELLKKILKQNRNAMKIWSVL